MMSNFTYKPSDYRNLIRMSNKKRLLVEGKEDKILFKLLLDELYSQKNKIDIDSAEDLINFDNAIGNRQKVEAICQSLTNEPYNHKLVGFVDREFRDFDISDTIQDNLNLHKVQGQLVWSRGHSMENYFFDFSILRDPLRDLSAAEWFDDALYLFKQLIDSTIRLACSVSLVGHELGILKRIKCSVSWQMLNILVASNNVQILFNSWEENFITDQNFCQEEAKKIITRYQYWHQIIEQADFKVVRWLCHGHIGIAVIWAVYSRCVYDICCRNKRGNPESEVAVVQRIKEENRTHTCASWWARKAVVNQCDYPIEVLKLLDITLSD
ncbi:DUF4435 domain-containing protein [Scytonema sp. UIC 10036]|uniref:DUF4435 domain-containing protein n=1 Tax=Scytonema sp. UIC 10036 TaxID=2304196 RepID=UPI0012DA1EE5|nr:DUF4435 domain-containing protein [Scytonema sp. UIC 10036]MUH00031.1 DUF4435 domain-containing protein [Scytonema sp. UIC 10036]